jgi:hypothetical protein
MPHYLLESNRNWRFVEAVRRKRATDRGKILEVWKKQSDAQWKCVVDTWNSGLPATPAPSK